MTLSRFAHDCEKVQRIIIVSSLFANNSRKILNPLKEEYIQGEERLNSCHWTRLLLLVLRLPVFHVHWSLLFCYRPIKKIELIHYPRGHTGDHTADQEPKWPLGSRLCSGEKFVPKLLSLVLSLSRNCVTKRGQEGPTKYHFSDHGDAHNYVQTEV